MGPKRHTHAIQTQSSLRSAISDLIGRATRQLRSDLRADPYLPYLLAVAVLIMGFWIWHSLPSFATRDERWRVLEPLEPIGFFIDDPGLSSIRDGVEFWRDYGATVHLYGLVLVPVLVYTVLTGQLDVVSAVAHHRQSALWAHWNRGPAWLWTTSVLLARLVNVVLAVGCVYVTYRIGTLLRDRPTGRLAGILVALTWGVVVLAHEAGEDVPALFFFLGVVYLGLRYIQSGDRRLFYAACLCGGIAIALKLTAGVSAILVGVAHLLRERRTDGQVWSSALRVRFLLTGITLALVAIVIGYPVFIVGTPDEFGGRILHAVTEKSGRTHGWLVKPSWWWLLRGYLHGLGLPLFAGSIVAVTASLPRLRERSLEAAGILLAVVGTGTFVAVYSFWGYVRMHHLLPTFPLLVVVLTIALRRVAEKRSIVVRVLVVGLVLTSGVYAGAGDLAYASQPRDEARAWLSDHASNTTTVETYVRDPQDTAVPHGTTVYRVTDRKVRTNGTTRTLSLGQWIQAMPRRCPTYVVLNYQRTLLYLAPDNFTHRASTLDYPPLKTHVEQLLSEGNDSYRVAARFGREPAFLRTNDSQHHGLVASVRHTDGESLGTNLVLVGLFPRTAQYGDPQDFGVNQYTVILERTDPCAPTE